jgi:ketosteroid isomerase-like protein
VKKFVFLFFVALLVSTGSAYAQDASLVENAINAINANDASYFEMHAAEDAVWLDEDGHAIAGERFMGFINGYVLNHPSEMTVENITVKSAGDVAWAYFRYAMEIDGAEVATGTGSAVFQRIGGDWKISMIHGPRDVVGAH